MPAGGDQGKGACMFEQTFVDGVGKTNKTWTVLVSFVGQIIILLICVILPMIYFNVLPKAQLTSFLAAPPPPPPPPPPPAAAAPVVKVKIIPRQFDAGRLMAPKSIPKDIAMIKEDELPPPSSGVGGVAGGIAGGVAGGTRAAFSAASSARSRRPFCRPLRPRRKPLRSASGWAATCSRPS